MGCTEDELSITLTDDRGIGELAARFGREGRPTDVLAFSMLEGAHSEFRGGCLGDVVISLDTAARQAAEAGLPLLAELEGLLIHGVLHLVGMDHQAAADARAMRELEAHLHWELARAR